MTDDTRYFTNIPFGEVTFALLVFLFQSDDYHTENFKDSLSFSLLWGEGDVCQVQVWRSEDSFVKSVLSVHLYVVPRIELSLLSSVFITKMLPNQRDQRSNAAPIRRHGLLVAYWEC